MIIIPRMFHFLPQIDSGNILKSMVGEKIIILKPHENLLNKIDLMSSTENKGMNTIYNNQPTLFLLNNMYVTDCFLQNLISIRALICLLMADGRSLYAYCRHCLV